MKIISCPSGPLDAQLLEKVDPKKVVSGNPASAHRIFYSAASDEMHCGIYACTAGKWRISYTEDEFCTVIEGHVRLESSTGETQDYHAPDSFIIPAGYEGTWEAVTPVRKFFVIYEKMK